MRSSYDQKIATYLGASLLAFIVFHTPVYAQETVHIRASDLVPTANLLLTPVQGSFTQDSTFDVSLYINTNGSEVGAVETHVLFDPKILTIVKPSGGSSIVGLWLEAPSYDNTKGEVTFIGGIPRGIRTDSGLIAKLTFQAKNTGKSVISVSKNSKVLLNDGLGSSMTVISGTAEYTVTATPPAGVTVSSETHPFSNIWYNNDSPSFRWNQDPSVNGFSVTLDNKPHTIPDNTVDTLATIQSYEHISDGIWFFHIKPLRNGIWGATSHYETKIDTAPPASFHPKIQTVTDEGNQRLLVSFFTTDELSGIDHYEVGSIDTGSQENTSPLFFRSESPYLMSAPDHGRHVVVRAFDHAGNVRDETVTIGDSLTLREMFREHLVLILLLTLALLISATVIHYLFGHHLIKHLRTLRRIIFNTKDFERVEDLIDRSS